MRTGLKIAVAVGLASLVLAGVAFAGWGGRGYGRGYGRGVGPAPGLEGQAPAEQQYQAPWMGRGPWGGAPGPQAGPVGPGWGAGRQTNNPPAAGGNYGFCPRCGAPCPRDGWAAPGAGLGYGPAAGRGPRFGRAGGPGPGFQGGPRGPQAQGFGFGRRNMMRRPGPMNDGWGQGFGRGPGGEGFAPQNKAPWGRPDRQGWRQPGDTDRLGPRVAPQQPSQGPDRGGFWGPPRDGGPRGRGERGLRSWRGPDIDDSEKIEENDSAPAPETEGTQQPSPQ